MHHGLRLEKQKGLISSTEGHGCSFQGGRKLDSPLRLTPCALRYALVVLKRMAVTEGLFLFFVPDLPGWSFQAVTAVGCLPPPLFSRASGTGARGSPNRNPLK
jgi:hypothetical protein